MNAPIWLIEYDVPPLRGIFNASLAAPDELEARRLFLTENPKAIIRSVKPNATLETLALHFAESGHLDRLARLFARHIEHLERRIAHYETTGQPLPKPIPPAPLEPPNRLATIPRMISDAQIDAFFDYGASPYAVLRLPDKVRHEVVRLTNDDWREVTPNEIEQVGIFDTDKAAETARRRLHVRWILEQPEPSPETSSTSCTPNDFPQTPQRHP